MVSCDWRSAWGRVVTAPATTSYSSSDDVAGRIERVRTVGRGWRHVLTPHVGDCLPPTRFKLKTSEHHPGIITAYYFSKLIN